MLCAGGLRAGIVQACARRQEVRRSDAYGTTQPAVWTIHHLLPSGERLPGGSATFRQRQQGKRWVEVGHFLLSV